MRSFKKGTFTSSKTKKKYINYSKMFKAHFEEYVGSWDNKFMLL